MARKKKRRAIERKSVSATEKKRTPRAGGDFNPDYTFVIKDLRRIALLTGVFLTILVALSFILR